MKETVRHQQAFEYYYMLGKERTYSKVASHFEISEVSVNKWAKEFNWKQRVIDRDTKNMQTIREQNDISVVKQMHNYRKIVSASIADYLKRLQDGKIKIETVNDFAKLVRLDLELCGFIDQSTQTEEDKKHIKELHIENLENKNKLLEAQIAKLKGSDTDDAYIKGFVADLDQLDE